jgi:hypothetical protein
MAISLWSRFPWWGLVLLAAVLTAVVYVRSDNARPTLGAIWFVALVLMLFGLRWLGQRLRQ